MYVMVSDVRDFISTGKPDAVIQLLIDSIEKAGPCLEGLGLSDDEIKLVMIYAIAHQLTLMDGGQVTSERNIAGNQVSWATPQGQGLASTTWGNLVLQHHGASCINDLINRSDIQVFSVGRRCK